MASREEPGAKWWLKSVPEARDWSEINVLRFLEHYENHPVLWNARAQEYENICLRRQSYAHIVQLLHLRDVGVGECVKLVGWLKKRYAEERAARGSSRARRPAWFKIVERLVRRNLSPEGERWNVNCCTRCCGCKSPTASTLSCGGCCAAQNLQSPGERSEASARDDADDRLSFRNVECYTVCNDETRLVLYSIAPRLEKFNSDCDCKTESGVDDDDNSKTSRSICDCRSGSTAKTSSSTASRPTDAQIRLQPIPSEPSSGTSSPRATTADEKSAGIYMNSRRFRGKRISLADEYAYDDRGQLQVAPPRLHFARCCCGSDIYPLQLEL